MDRFKRNAAKLEAHHSYSPAQEHDSCGVGLVAAIDGKPRREVVTAGIAALKAVWHRGAVDADGKTGDGPDGDAVLRRRAVCAGRRHNAGAAAEAGRGGTYEQYIILAHFGVSVYIG